MTDLLSGLRLYKQSDINDLARLLGEAGGWATHTAPAPEELRARWLRRGTEPEAVVRVLPDPDGRLIAYYHATPFRDSAERIGFEAAVHPDWRGRGIGSQLYNLALEEAYRRGVNHIATPVYRLLGDRNQEGVDFLLARGFQKQSAYWQMRVDRLSDQPQSPWPPGFSAQPFPSVSHAAERWAKLIAIAFNETATREMIETQIKEPGSNPNGYFFALEQSTGKLVGTSRARLDPSPSQPNGVMGYIGTVGVLPEYRRRGLAHALLGQTLLYLHEEGAENATLFVEESNTNAQALYKSLGWYHVFRSDNYWKRLG